MTKTKTTKKKLKHDQHNSCDSTGDSGGVIPDQQQSGGLPHKDTLSWNTTYKWCGIQDGCGIRPECSKERCDELKRHSAMLGRIACYVADFCDEEDTTLTGVIKIAARLKEYEAEELWDSYYEERNNQ